MAPEISPKPLDSTICDTVSEAELLLEPASSWHWPSLPKGLHTVYAVAASSGLVVLVYPQTPVEGAEHVLAGNGEKQQRRPCSRLGGVVRAPAAEEEEVVTER